VLEQMLEDIYAKGREVNYKPPVAIKSDGATVERTETPPVPPQQGGSGSSASITAPTTPVKGMGIGLAPRGESAGKAAFLSRGFTNWSPSPSR